MSDAPFYVKGKRKPPPVKETDGKKLKSAGRNAVKQRQSTITAPLSLIETKDLAGKAVVYTKKGQIETLSPGQVAHIRGRIGTMVREHLELADLVVRGKLEWSPTQARIFATLINKVVPDLSASFHAHEHRTQGIREMSRADLERIARGLDDAKTITAEYEMINPAPETALDENPEPGEGRSQDEPDA